MPQSLGNIVVHLVFSTKHRAPTLTAAVREELYPYLGGVLRGYDCAPIQIGGVEDHVHILFKLSRTHAMAFVTQQIKVSTSKWIHENYPSHGEFAWQGGYGAFSVGQREIEVVTRYIARQGEHHRTHSFQDEFRELLNEAGLTFDERYVWD
jgi:putative transposase